jgi:hypothetical protein
MNIFIHNSELNHMNYHIYIYIYIEMLSIDVIYTYIFQP